MPRVLARLDKKKKKASKYNVVPSIDTISQCSHVLGDVMTVS